MILHSSWGRGALEEIHVFCNEPQFLERIFCDIRVDKPMFLCQQNIHIINIDIQTWVCQLRYHKKSIPKNWGSSQKTWVSSSGGNEVIGSPLKKIIVQKYMDLH